MLHIIVANVTLSHVSICSTTLDWIVSLRTRAHKNWMPLLRPTLMNVDECSYHCSIFPNCIWTVTICKSWTTGNTSFPFFLNKFILFVQVVCGSDDAQLAPYETNHGFKNKFPCLYMYSEVCVFVCLLFFHVCLYSYYLLYIIIFIVLLLYLLFYSMVSGQIRSIMPFMIKF